MPTRSPFGGLKRKLVLALDVGTTYSGISYSILDPGQVPEIRGVTRYPAQERVGGDSKIPTIIYYDQEGKVRAVGAEAMQESLRDRAEDEGWTKAEWFKLHMAPKNHSQPRATITLPPLPPNKSVVELFADFMEYLYNCAKAFIQDTHSNGSLLWASVEQNIEFVLSHPNGWEGAQQSQMRRAAVLGGLIPDTTVGHERVHFVTEGEACLHFCIQSGLTTEALKEGNGILIVDAGGGTIDISAYGKVTSSRGHSFEEIVSPQCHFQGSVFVTNRARLFLEELLEDSKFSDDVDHITECFDRTTKLAFRNSSEPQFIKFGSTRDRDPKLNIRSGQLRLSGTNVSTFFNPSVSCAVKAITEICGQSRRNISSVFLVGGFAASSWLFSTLKDSLEPFGLMFCRPDSHVNKAVADGAVSFYLDGFVRARVSKFTYGAGCSVRFNPSNKQHILRSSSRFTDIDGEEMLSGAFSIILKKDTKVFETKEFRRSYTSKSRLRAASGSICSAIYCYQGPSKRPEWLDVDTEMYSILCHIVADTSQISKTLKPRQPAGGGEEYFEMCYKIILSFGLTELKAQIAWVEDGEEKRGPAKLVYDVDDN